MKKNKQENYFWMSFSDLMTSLFFIVLVLYVITYITLKKKEVELNKTVDDLMNKDVQLNQMVDDLKKKETQLIETVDDLKYKLEVFRLVEENLKPLKDNTSLFKYEEKYKRFTLAFDVNFELSQYEIKDGKLKNFGVTSQKIQNAGKHMQNIIDVLAENQKKTSMKNVSYLVIISGYASHLLKGTESNDYELSYKRAYSLWNYWKNIGIDFEAEKYKGLIDLQIAGNGWGGVGRFERDPQNYFENEVKNQRFIIQIIPKIGNINQE